MPHQCTTCGRTFADGSKEMLSGCPDCGGNKFQFSPGGFDAADTTSTDSPADSPNPGPSEDPASRQDTDPREDTGPSTPDRAGDAVSRTVGNAAATVRDIVGGRASADATSAKPPEPAGQAHAPEPDGRSVADSPDETTPDTDDGAVPDGTFAPDPDDLANGFADVETGSDDDIIVAESAPLEGEDDAQADARSQIADPTEVRDQDGADEDDPAASDDASDRTVVEEPDAEQADRPDLSELREELNDQFESIRVVEPGQYELNLMELFDREAYIIALQEDGRYSIQMPESWREADV